MVKSRLDEATLERIAVDTGGVYLHAAGAGLGLAELYRDYIATLEKRELDEHARAPLRASLPDAAGARLPPAAGRAARAIDAPGDRPATRRSPAVAPRRAPSRLLLALAVVSVGWLDPPRPRARGQPPLRAGKYDDAAEEYNEALVDEPDSARLHFNLGDARYKAGKYDEALASFEKVPAGDDGSGRTAQLAYNVGNTKYRQGAGARAAGAAEGARRCGARRWSAYRRALGADPDDVDAKFNHELVEQEDGGAEEEARGRAAEEAATAAGREAKAERDRRSRTSSSRARSSRRRRAATGSEAEGGSGPAAGNRKAGSSRASSSQARSRKTRSRSRNRRSSDPSPAASKQEAAEQRKPRRGRATTEASRRRREQNPSRDGQPAEPRRRGRRHRPPRPGGGGGPARRAARRRRCSRARSCGGSTGLASPSRGRIGESRRAVSGRRGARGAGRHRRAGRGDGAGAARSAPRRGGRAVRAHGGGAGDAELADVPAVPVPDGVGGAVRRSGDAALDRERTDQLVDHAPLRGDARAAKARSPSVPSRSTADGQTLQAGTVTPPGVGRRRRRRRRAGRPASPRAGGAADARLPARARPRHLDPDGRCAPCQRRPVPAGARRRLRARALSDSPTQRRDMRDGVSYQIVRVPQRAHAAPDGHGHRRSGDDDDVGAEPAAPRAATASSAARQRAADRRFRAILWSSTCCPCRRKASLPISPVPWASSPSTYARRRSTWRRAIR